MKKKNLMFLKNINNICIANIIIICGCNFQNNDINKLRGEELAKMHVYLSNVSCYEVNDSCNKYSLLRFPLLMNKVIKRNDTIIYKFKYNADEIILNNIVNKNCDFVVSVGFIKDQDTIRFVKTYLGLMFEYYTYNDIVNYPNRYSWIENKYIDSIKSHKAPCQYISPCIIDKLKKEKDFLDPWLQEKIYDYQ